MPAAGSRSRMVAVVLLWCATLVPLSAAAARENAAMAAMLRELSTGSAVQRVEFVEAAVTELVAAHQVAARRAGKDAAPRGVRWAASTRAYIDTLNHAVTAARAGARVRLLADRDHNVRVIVGERPARQFMLTAPNGGDRGRLEQAVLRRYRARPPGDAGSLSSLAAVTPPPPISATPAALATTAELPQALELTVISGWVAPVSVAPPAPPRSPVLVKILPAGDDGLRCGHDAGRHQILYDRACANLLADTRALVQALHAAARRGVVIDWGLDARPVAVSASQELAVNRDGGKVELKMPSLALAPELLQDILPWAQARLGGVSPPLTLTPPARLIYLQPIAQI